jgi:hypothetical protein
MSFQTPPPVKREDSSSSSVRESFQLRHRDPSFDEDHSYTSRIAHTLTACCRCRSVSGSRKLVRNADLCRGKPSVIRAFRDAVPVIVQAPFANTSILLKDEGYLEHMSYTFKTGSNSLSWRFRSSRMRNWTLLILKP